jgi:tRNA(Arg) A34 adenosine deaminase TadA
MGADCIGADRIASPTEDVSRRTLIAGAVGALALPIASPALLVPSPAQARGIAQAVQPDDERFMRMAIAEAARGDYPFGSVIVRDGKVMVKGRNLAKQEKNPTAHGEMVAIRRFLTRYGPDKLKGTTLYTSGESCAMCMGAILWCGISRLVYGASLAELAAKIGQIMVLRSPTGRRSPRSRSPAGCSRRNRSHCSNEAYG